MYAGRGAPSNGATRRASQQHCRMLFRYRRALVEMEMCKIDKLIVYLLRLDRRGSGVQGCDCNATVVGSALERMNYYFLIFSFLSAGTKA